MKYLKYFLFVGIVLIMSSYTTRTSGLSEGVYPGDLMPELNLNDNSDKGFNLASLRGKKVLVNFWAAYDAESRMKNVLLWNTLQKEKFPLTMLSVAFDKSRSVSERTLKMDGITPDSLFFYENGSDSEVYKACRLKKGFKNYLIDENGVIVAMNLTPEDLRRFFN